MIAQRNDSPLADLLGGIQHVTLSDDELCEAEHKNECIAWKFHVSVKNSDFVVGQYKHDVPIMKPVLCFCASDPRFDSM